MSFVVVKNDRNVIIIWCKILKWSIKSIRVTLTTSDLIQLEIIKNTIKTHTNLIKRVIITTDISWNELIKSYSKKVITKQQQQLHI